MKSILICLAPNRNLTTVKPVKGNPKAIPNMAFINKWSFFEV
jgi:hypothetical protein